MNNNQKKLKQDQNSKNKKSFLYNTKDPKKSYDIYNDLNKKRYNSY